MGETLYAVYLARHGETAWSILGQHTGLTDLPLTERGRRNATRLGERLKGQTFAKVFTSPLQRAATTCELAGFGATAQSDSDLVEWDYGQYEVVKPMRLPKFPLVNDEFLAEALRQVIPVAQDGVAALKTYEAAAPLLRAHIALEMWCRQKRGPGETAGRTTSRTP